MKIGVLGTGMVGQAIASKLAELGHDVMMGSRTADNTTAAEWAARMGARASTGTFADAVGVGEVVFNCTRGTNSLEALEAAGARNLEGKVLVDVANLLSADPAGPESLGEQIQNAFPLARVVKTMNTVNCDVMVNPRRLADPHTIFLSGNDARAKETARALLESFGWIDILDLGDIATARAAEGLVPLWVALWKRLGTVAFNIKVVR
jgi:8-hydroxy-5-deazaflavin:NADPH oxidoreductase